MIKQLLSKYQKDKEKSDHENAIKAIINNDIPALEKLKLKNYDFNSLLFYYSNVDSFISDKNLRSSFNQALSAFSYEVDNIDLNHSELNLLSLSVLFYNDLISSQSINSIEESAFFFLLNNKTDPFFKDDDKLGWKTPAIILAVNLILPDVVESIFNSEENLLFINKTYENNNNILFYIPFRNSSGKIIKEEEFLSILDFLIKKGINHTHCNDSQNPFYKKQGYNLDLDCRLVQKIHEQTNLLSLNEDFHFHCLAYQNTFDYVKSLNLPFDSDKEIIHFDIESNQNLRCSEILLFEVAKYESRLNDFNVQNSHLDKILSLYGNNINYQNSRGESILHILAKTNNTDKIISFLSHPDIDLSLLDDHNNTFLHAVIELKKDIDSQYLNLIFDKIIPVCLLLGMNLNQTNDEGVNIRDHLSKDMKSLIRKHEKNTLNKILGDNYQKEEKFIKKRI